MLKNKNTVIVFVSVVVILVLGISVAFQSASINEMKTANGVAQDRINTLYGQIDSLNSALGDTSANVEKYKGELEKNKQELEKNKSEVEKNKQEIKKYQEILTVWNDASQNVRSAIEKVTNSYSQLVGDAHLYPDGALDGTYEKMMDTVYAIIRSTNPQNVADDFVTALKSLNSKRFDVIMQEKINAVKVGGVIFPEDVRGYEEAMVYYNSFADNSAIMLTFAEMGFDAELDSIFEMLDADEERDLAEAFVSEVEAVDLPLTLSTSLKDAMLAWDALQNALESYDVLDERTANARKTLDSYIEYMEELATPPHNCADCIRAKLSELLAIADEATRAFLEEVAREVEALLEVLNIEEANKCLERAIETLCPCSYN